MKRILSFAVMALLAGSCCVNPTTSTRLKMKKHYVELDYSAQEVRLDANIKLTLGSFMRYTSDSESSQEHYQGTFRIASGDWFKIILDYNDRKYLTLEVEENDWGRDRLVLVYAGAYADSDTVRVVQKAKP